MTGELLVGTANGGLCPVCGIELNIGSFPVVDLMTVRGNQQWARCPRCRSFFAMVSYNLEEETVHIRARPYGAMESGIALNDEKSPMYEAILRLLRRFARPGSTLLDIGCSYGGFLRRAQEEGYEVRGIDILPEAVEYVRSQGIPCDGAASVDDIVIPKNSMKIVSVLDCNLYWPDQVKELRGIHSILEPAGLLVMRTVDTSIAIRLGIWLRRWLPDTGRRLREYAVYDHRISIPVRSLLEIVRQQGFEIICASPRAAMPLRHNSLKVRIVYAIGQLTWLMARYNVAPGFVFLARKKTT